MTLTTEQAAEAAGVSPVTIRQWVMRGWIEPVRRGAKPLRFDYDEVARCQREHRPATWERQQRQRIDALGACLSGESER